jgi:hypothetical protein
MKLILLESVFIYEFNYIIYLQNIIKILLLIFLVKVRE